MSECTVLDRLMAAHGGRQAWADLTAISACLSSDGLAYASRLQSRALLHKRIVVRFETRRVTIADFPRPGWWGEWHDPRVSVGPDGEPPARTRTDARRRLKGWLAQPRWDDLDLLYFVGYALWNYLSFPRLLKRPGVEVRPVRGGPMGQPTLSAARFPADIPTHGAERYFHLNGEGWLLRHDDVAEVFGRWAAGANHCLHSEVVDGLRLYTRRRVTPSLGRWASLPLPTLVRIELDDVAVHRAHRPPCLDDSASRQRTPRISTKGLA